jgi:hypothetical protein
MKTYVLCPISDKKIDESVARTIAAFAFLIVLSFAFTQSIIPLLFLAADFLLRAMDLSNYSPVALASRRIVWAMGIDKSYINAGPKIFAARLGLFMVSLIIIFVFFNLGWLALVLAGVLGLFSFLETAFRLCVACEIYPYLYRYLYRQG